MSLDTFKQHKPLPSSSKEPSWQDRNESIRTAQPNEAYQTEERKSPRIPGIACLTEDQTADTWTKVLIG